MGRHRSMVERAGALGLLVDGFSTVEVARRQGLWLNQLRRWASMAGMEFAAGRHGGLRAVPGQVEFAGSGHGYRLSLTDRAQIAAYREQGMSMRAVAGKLGVAPSTISRELKRHTLSSRGHTHYDVKVADWRARKSRSRPKPVKLETNPQVRRVVVEMLNKKFSPAQVAAQLRIDYPNRPEMRVSHETIYQALYVQGKGALRHELTVVKALRSGRTTRIPQSKLPRRSARPWLEGARLSDRPAEVSDRAVPGHWEGDLVVGPGNSGIITLVERASRFALIGRLPGRRDSRTVTSVLQTMIKDLPAQIARSLTWDQGQEMAEHAKFTIATGIPVYFCDPHSPWQRGSNENLNGLIRDYYPKGTNFNHVTDTDLNLMQHQLNIRPRQTLNWATPAATLETYIQTVALTT